jgi:hypothetical protein
VTCHEARLLKMLVSGLNRSAHLFLDVQLFARSLQPTERSRVVVAGIDHDGKQQLNRKVFQWRQGQGRHCRDNVVRFSNANRVISIETATTDAVGHSTLLLGLWRCNIAGHSFC